MYFQPINIELVMSQKYHDQNILQEQSYVLTILCTCLGFSKIIPNCVIYRVAMYDS